MGSYLADTNLLLRLADPASEQHPVATQALARLLGQGDEVYLTPQNFIEFWAVAAQRAWRIRSPGRADVFDGVVIGAHAAAFGVQKPGGRQCLHIRMHIAIVAPERLRRARTLLPLCRRT